MRMVSASLCTGALAATRALRRCRGSLCHVARATGGTWRWSPAGYGAPSAPCVSRGVPSSSAPFPFPPHPVAALPSPLACLRCTTTAFLTKPGPPLGAPAAVPRMSSAVARGAGEGSGPSDDGSVHQILVQHLVVPEGEGQGELVFELFKKLEKGEAQLDDLAAQFSHCPSKAKGGVLGWISRGQTVLDFEAAAFNAPLGAVVQAKTEHGYHLLKVLEERRVTVVRQIAVDSFEEVRAVAALSARREEKGERKGHGEEGGSPPVMHPDDVGDGPISVQLVDVREPRELQLASIPGFQSFPLSQFSEWGPNISSLLSPSAPTFVLCHHGVRSQQMAQFLVSQGFNEVYNISGGIDAYSLDVDASIPRY